MKSQSSSIPATAPATTLSAPAKGTMPSMSSISARSTSRFSFGVRLRQQFADGRNARRPMGPLNHVFCIEPVPNCPLFPNASYSRSGINQHSVQIKQHTTARDSNHDSTISGRNFGWNFRKQGYGNIRRRASFSRPHAQIAALTAAETTVSSSFQTIRPAHSRCCPGSASHFQAGYLPSPSHPAQTSDRRSSLE